MKRSLRSPLVAVGLAGAIVAGVVGAAGIASAQDSTPGSTPTETAPAVEEMRAHRGHLIGLAAIIQQSGLDRQVFVDGFEAGKTVAQVLEENGINPETLKAEILANADAALDDILGSTPDLPLGGDHGGKPFPRLAAGVETIAGLIGITPEELGEAMRAGDTIAEIAEANGVDVQTVVDGIVADANAKLAEAVADGRITQEKADEIGAELEERITTFVNEGGRPGAFGGGRFHRGGGPGAGMPGGASSFVN